MEGCSRVFDWSWGCVNTESEGSAPKVRLAEVAVVSTGLETAGRELCVMSPLTSMMGYCWSPSFEVLLERE